MKIEKTKYTFKLSEIIKAVNWLPRYGDLIKDIKKRYWFGRNTVTPVEREMNEIDNARNQLINKWGEKQKDGHKEVIGNWDKYIKELKSFLDTEIEIEIDPILLSDIISIEKLGKDISTQMLSGLGKFVIDDTEKTK